ncbi:comF family protein [bacterium A37T11]|nr:comF family protein [bacterium A37T11]
MKIGQYLHDFGSLFFPELCPGCGKALIHQEKCICTDCLYKLPYTNFHQDPENLLAKQLWGLARVEAATAYLHFSKESKVQRIIHQLKYGHAPQLGEWLGERFGSQLALTAPYHAADLIIPVPLHPAKLRIRGYNQALYIAKGLSKKMGIPVIDGHLIRHSNNKSQTRKNRYERYENSKDIFSVRRPQILAHRRLLLVDDVVTTGATAEACLRELLKIEGTSVMLVTLAHGH